MTTYILALDQDTTSSRAILFDHAGRLHGIAQQEFRQIFPHSCWIEHDANDQQCLAHAAVQHPYPAMGRRAAGAARHPAQPAAAGGARQRGGRDNPHRTVRRRHPDRRHRRHGQEHLRHRLLHADEHRQAVASHNQLLGTIGWTIGGQTDYLLEGSVFNAGAAVQWLRDGLGIIGSSAEVEALAASVPDAGGVWFVPAFAGLGELRVDGGAVRNDLLMQADVQGEPVVSPVVTETTALGAAYLAGLAVGYWESQEEIAAQWQAEKRFELGMSADERQQRLATWRRAVQRARAWIT